MVNTKLPLEVRYRNPATHPNSCDCPECLTYWREIEEKREADWLAENERERQEEALIDAVLGTSVALYKCQCEFADEPVGMAACQDLRHFWDEAVERYMNRPVASSEGA